jgi:plasmid stabilization system protein ParE
VRLVWSPFAIEDRAQLFDFIALENPVAAVHCDREIAKEGIRSLLDQSTFDEENEAAGYIATDFRCGSPL